LDSLFFVIFREIMELTEGRIDLQKFLKKISFYFLVEWKRSFNFARAFGGMIVRCGRESVRIKRSSLKILKIDSVTKRVKQFVLWIVFVTIHIRVIFLEDYYIL